MNQSIDGTGVVRMKKNNDSLPTSILKMMQERNYELSLEERSEAFHYLETQHALNPADFKITHAFIRLLNQGAEYKAAKAIGQEFLMMVGYNKEILSELASTYQNLDEMDQYFMLVRQYTEEENQIQQEEQIVDNIIPFPKKLVTRKPQANFLSLDSQEQLVFLSELNKFDIDLYKGDFIAILADKKASPFVQSVIFELLHECQIDDTVLVCKLGEEAVFNPQSLETDSFLDDMEAELSFVLENDNPVLFMQIFQMVQHHYFMLYPFSFKPKNVSLWVECYILWANELYGEEKVTLSSDLSAEVEKGLNFIRKLEESGQNYLF